MEFMFIQKYRHSNEKKNCMPTSYKLKMPVVTKGTLVDIFSNYDLHIKLLKFFFATKN